MPDIAIKFPARVAEENQSWARGRNGGFEPRSCDLNRYEDPEGPLRYGIDIYSRQIGDSSPLSWRLVPEDAWALYHALGQLLLPSLPPSDHDD
jgi:hypothetical protein